MWKSSEDVVKDLSQIDSFGEMSADDLKAYLTHEKSDNEETPKRFLDPRTGEEIDISSESTFVECDGRHVTSGRGKLIEEFRYNINARNLQKQLRKNRPLGFGNDMIESYFAGRKQTEEAEETVWKEELSARYTIRRKRNGPSSSLPEKESDEGEVCGGMDEMFPERNQNPKSAIRNVSRALPAGMTLDDSNVLHEMKSWRQ